MEEIKCLILSNMYPSKDKPYAGIFVKNQYKKIQSLLNGEKESIDIKYMRREITGVIGSIYKYISFFIRTSSIFRKEYDVIHLHYFFPLAIIPYLYKKIYPDCKVLITFHGSDVYRFMDYKIINFFFKTFAENADVLIPVGRDLGEDLRRKLNLKPDFVISAGVDRNVFFRKTTYKKKYDFLFVGSFINRKGVDLICKAIRKRGDKNISFCFVGSGLLEENISNLKNDGYNITIKKNQTQDELRTIYNQSKWLLFPSRNEPFGLVVTESIFCGTPALTSKVGGIKEQVKEGYNGYFLEKIDVDSINKSIDKILSMDCQKYQEIAKNCLSSNLEFSLTSVCERLLDIYRQK